MSKPKVVDIAVRSSCTNFKEDHLECKITTMSGEMMTLRLRGDKGSIDGLGYMLRQLHSRLVTPPRENYTEVLKYE